MIPLWKERLGAYCMSRVAVWAAVQTTAKPDEDNLQKGRDT